MDEESDDEIDMIGFEFDITPLGTLKKSPAFKRDLSSSQRLNLSYGKQTTLVKQLTGLSEDESSFNDEEKESQNFGKSSIHFSKGSFISKNPNDKEIILAGRLSEVVEEKKKFFDLEKDGISGSSSESLGDWDAEIEEEEKNSGSFKAPPLSISDLKNGTMFKDFVWLFIFLFMFNR